MKVVIFDDGFIPGLGRGPFKNPIEISEDKFFLYKQMGIKVINAGKTVPIVESGIRNRVIVKKEELPVEEENVEIINPIKKTVKEEVIEKDIEQPKEEIIEEEISDEEVVNENEEEISDEEVVNENEEEISDEIDEDVSLDDLSKRELMAMLDEKGVSYQKTMNKATLTKMIEEVYSEDIQE